jgi:hypothetical protein
MYGHHILDYFFLCKVYLIKLKCNLFNFLKNPTNNAKLECMEYIYDKIIPITKFEKNSYILHLIKVVNGIIG